ncbi:MAG: GNAT family N-acetyltransferase [Oscillospiraceae bacterium]|nr:GNAT family N-acetyltransferase [Oscillospiraceae bacterium]
MRDFISKEPINKGWSGDKKYCVTAPNSEKYLLRITPKEKAANRANCFRMQTEIAALGVPMCRPLEYGECDEGIYILQSWIEGRDAEEVIPTLSSSEQYAYGIKAGNILKKIHSVPAPRDLTGWETRFNAKIDRKIKMYSECPVKFEGDADVLQYIEQNRYLLKNRPQSFQHGDYHIGNMMIDKNGELNIIDFDRYDFGDPWEEFNRIVWCAQVAPPFASGIVDGYFENSVPLEFWKLLALYICSNTLSSVPWAIPFGEKEVKTMLNQAKDVLAWYNNMQTAIPSWYTEFPVLTPVAKEDISLFSGTGYENMSADAKNQMVNDSIKKQYKDGNYFEVFSVRFGENVVGFVSLYSKKKGEVSIGLDIRKPYRSRGYGTRSAEAISLLLKEKGFSYVCDSVRTDNEASVRLHKKLGFSCVDKYTAEKGASVFVFRKNLRNKE